MKRLHPARMTALIVFAMLCGLLSATEGWAATASWIVDGDGNWATGTNWDTNVSPNGIDDVANLTLDLTIDADITLDASITLGTLNIGDSGGTENNYAIIPATSETITFDVSSGNAAINQLLGTTNTISADLILNDKLDITHDGTSGNLNLDGVISGSGGIERLGGPDGLSGNRVFISNSANSYTGDTTITAGRIRPTANGAIPHGAGKGNVVIGALGGLEMTTFANPLTINGLGGNGLVNHGSGAGNTLTLEIGDGDATSDFAGTIQIESALNPGTRKLNIEKIGEGTQTLSGNNTYNGTTTVAAGTLLVTGTHLAADSNNSDTFLGDYTVSSGGTLGGTGTVGATVSLEGGTLSPGASVGTLTVNELTVSNNSTFNFELDPTDMTVGGSSNDLLAISGELDMPSSPSGLTLNVTAIGGGDFGATGTWTLATYGSLSASSGIPLFDITGLDSGLGGVVSYEPDDSESPLGPGAMNLIISSDILTVTIDRDTVGNRGQIVLDSTTPVTIIGYMLTSEVGALDPAGWKSIAENYDSDNGGSIDPDDKWTELTHADSRTDLSEAEFDGGNGASLDGVSIDLGDAWIKNNETDTLVMNLLLDNGSIMVVPATFVGDLDDYLFGDLNYDGVIDADDFYEVFVPNYLSDTSSLNSLEKYQVGDFNDDDVVNIQDYFAFRDVYLAANPGAAELSFGSVPEPTGIALFALGSIALLGRRLRTAQQSRHEKPTCEVHPGGFLDVKRPQCTRTNFLVAIAMLCGLFAMEGTIYAATGSWNVDNSGNWTEDFDWNGTHPDGVDDVAIFADPSVTITTDRFILLDDNITLGTLNIDYAFSANGNNFIIGETANSLTFDVSSGNATINKTGGRADLISAPIILNDDLDFNIVAGANPTFSGVISGNHGINRIGGTDGVSGLRLILSNPANIYTGDTVITAGRLRATENGVIPHGPGKGNLVIAVSGGLELIDSQSDNLEVYMINGLSGSGFVVHGAPTPDDLTLAVGDNDATSEFSGTIQLETPNDPQARIMRFEKIGAGTQTLSGDNTYNGTTTVTAGTLLVNGTHGVLVGSIGDYLVTGGTLGGTGTIGATVVMDGGTLSPGASPGTLGVGGLTVNSNSSFNYELKPTDTTVGSGVNDLTDINGILDLSSNPTDISLNIQAIGGGNFDTSGTWTLATYDALNVGGGIGISVNAPINSHFAGIVTIDPDDSGDPLGPGAVNLTIANYNDLFRVQINRTTGAVALINPTGEAVDFYTYQLLSDLGSLSPGEWDSLDDMNFGGAGTWSELGTAITELSEVSLDVNGSLPAGTVVDLGDAYDETKDFEDVEFLYESGTTEFLNDGLVQYLVQSPGDMDGDGDVDEEDVPLFVLALTNRASYEALYPTLDTDEVGDVNNNGTFDFGDIALFSSMVSSATGSGSAVPEPSACALLGLTLIGLIGRSSHRSRKV